MPTKMIPMPSPRATNFAGLFIEAARFPSLAANKPVAAYDSAERVDDPPEEAPLLADNTLEQLLAVLRKRPSPKLYEAVEEQLSNRSFAAMDRKTAQDSARQIALLTRSIAENVCIAPRRAATIAIDSVLETRSPPASTGSQGVSLFEHFPNAKRIGVEPPPVKPRQHAAVSKELFKRFSNSSRIVVR